MASIDEKFAIQIPKLKEVSLYLVAYSIKTSGSIET